MSHLHLQPSQLFTIGLDTATIDCPDNSPTGDKKRGKLVGIKPVNEGESNILKNSPSVSSFNRLIYQKLKESLGDSTDERDRPFILTVGGDHSTAMGSILALNEVYDGRLGIIWVDAHADINTPHSSITKNVHGCPVSLLMDLENARAQDPAFEWTRNKMAVKPIQLVYIGLRALDQKERDILVKWGISFFTMFEVEKFGIDKTIEMALHAIDPRGELPLHFSFDVDSVDPSFIAATGTPEPGGLTFREARYLAHKLNGTGRLVSMDLVELNPGIGTEEQVNRSFRYATEVVNAALGHYFV